MMSDVANISVFGYNQSVFLGKIGIVYSGVAQR